jgi:peptide/nickel transport system ATP-binding protein
MPASPDTVGQGPVLLRVSQASKQFAPSLSFGDHIASWLGQKVDRRIVHAVDHVSLELHRGEVLGLVGESGCGKSTLGRMMAGIYPPSRGRVELDGVPVMGAGNKPLKTTTRIQMVFQDPFASLDPRVRIGETIGEGPLFHGLVDQDHLKSYVRQWLETVGLPAEAADRFPHQFSGGQRQRVAIARALAMQPDVLICDEPVASLDVSIQAQIINLFLKLKHELKLTMLFISHDLGVIRHITDNIAVMYLGRIVEIGTRDAIYTRPKHPYTVSLLSAVPIPDPDTERTRKRIPLIGEIGSANNTPSGCRFHPRCPRAREIAQQPHIAKQKVGVVDIPVLCATQDPALLGSDQEHACACHFPHDTL